MWGIASRSDCKLLVWFALGLIIFLVVCGDWESAGTGCLKVGDLVVGFLWDVTGI